MPASAVRLARRTAWRSVAEVAGGFYADLPRTAEVAAVDVVHRPAVPARPGPQPPPPVARPARQSAPLALPVPQSPPVARSVPQPPAAVNAHRPRPAPVDGLRERVFALLDEQFSPADVRDIEDDDSYLLWMTARALGVDDHDVTDYIRQWRHAALSRAVESQY